MFKFRKAIIPIIYLFLIYFKLNILEVYTEEIILFTSRILRLCKDYDRLTKNQLLQLEAWIDETISTKVLSFNTKYNLKSCKKKINSANENAKIGIGKKTKGLVKTNKLYNKLSSSFNLLKKNINLSDLTFSEFNRLQKQSQQKKKESINNKLSELLKSKDALLDNVLFDDLVDPEYSKNTVSELIGDEDKLLHEGIRVSDYFDNDGKPLIRETERLTLFHKSVELYVPIEMPLFFIYSKTQKYLLGEQPTEIQIPESYSISSSDISIDKLGNLGEDIQHIQCHDQEESEIIDKSTDGFDNSASEVSTELDASNEVSSDISYDDTKREQSTTYGKSEHSLCQRGTDTCSRTQDESYRSAETRSEYSTGTESEYDEDSRTTDSRRSSVSGDYTDERSSQGESVSNESYSDESKTEIIGETDDSDSSKSSKKY